LALREYQRAEAKAPEDFVVLHELASTLGKLNREAEAIGYLERVLRLHPDSPDVIADLGWLYFKTHRLAEGERLLLGALDRLGDNRSFAMTLGTIYSDMYEYEKSKRYYLQSIEQALEHDAAYFASVAYYNLSLLEQTFYQYNSALDYTQRSIDLAERATGHIAKGELYLMRMDYRRAHAEYQAAFNVDSTPLSKLSLADLYQVFGYLDRAYAYVRDVMDDGDLSWMYYYGTDTQRHFMDLHGMLADIHDGMAVYRRVLPKRGVVDWLVSLWDRARHRILGYYHRQQFRRYSFAVGKAYLREENALNAYWSFYRANEAYPRIAYKYLRLAEEFELSVTEGAEGFYLVERGTVLRDRDTLERALRLCHPVWERELMADALVELVPVYRRSDLTAAANRALARLYRLNPGALLQAGLGLPLRLSVTGRDPVAAGRVSRIARRALRRGGSVLFGPDEQIVAGFHLRVELRDGEARYVLQGPAGGGTSGTVEMPGSSRPALKTAVGELIRRIYRPD
jgi:tetratricopeptide (TPR) repeat protein